MKILQYLCRARYYSHTVPLKESIEIMHATVRPKHRSYPGITLNPQNDNVD